MCVSPRISFISVLKYCRALSLLQLDVFLLILLGLVLSLGFCPFDICYIAGFHSSLLIIIWAGTIMDFFILLVY